VEAALPHLLDAAEEMDKRYQVLFREGFESLSDRFKDGKKDIPYHLIVFDEFADLILSDKKTKKDFEAVVTRLAAKGRAAGIHLVLATQRPDKNVVTGLIKANLPLKVCMRVINATNSSIILDQTGAEKLLGRGDLLCDRGKGIERAQSPYIRQDEFRKLGG
jgi:S-DNA-T family DNA segregation ATPase FtsK/SpoIIIE